MHDIIQELQECYQGKLQDNQAEIQYTYQDRTIQELKYKTRQINTNQDRGGKNNRNQNLGDNKNRKTKEI